MDAEITIIGAGVVGLAIAQKLAAEHPDVVVVEQESGIGHHSSSRNSEVVHAGFYYPTGSLKAESCVRGRHLLNDYANRKGVPLQTIGKVVVAANAAEIEKLEELLERGHQNGVEGLSVIGESELKKLEPALQGCGALHSRETGIVDSHALMESLRRDFEDQGGIMALSSPVKSATPCLGGMQLEIGGRDETSLTSSLVINAAGLFAPEMAARLGTPIAEARRGRMVKGNYLSYQGRSPFRRLVYPLPSRDGLGIHATLDMAGRLRFGPDTEEVDSIDYGVDSSIRERFAESIRQYWPGVASEKLQPDYAGIRSKLVVPEGGFSDFVIEDRRAQGSPVINLFGIESPGLTSALALAERVAALIR